ncbi:MAG: 4Fe-4S dicluster domain-containing protein [Planctomycetota bacterium]|nr:MAG: 4Fe-4S dicluster domain-containing protein [Planctomycetota bacterium]
MLETIYDHLMDRLSLSPLFEGIPEDLLRKIVYECEIIRALPEDIIYREGVYSEDFYVILQGLVRLQKNTNTGPKYIASVGKDDFFGEMGPLSGHPRWESAIAEALSYILKIPSEIFHELLSKSPHIKEMVDLKYMERSIFGHLRIAPLFECIEDDKDLMFFVKVADLVSYQKGDILCKEGEEGNAFYMIRNGYAKVTTTEQGEEKILAYLRENMYFGELALLKGVPWNVTITAMTNLEAIRIEKGYFQEFVKKNYQLAQYVYRNWQEYGELSVSGVSQQEQPQQELDVFINKGVIMAKDAIVIDLNKCIRCNECVKVCKEVHGGDVSRLVKRQGFRYDHLLYATACYSCASPDCMLGCKFSAITRDANGNVHILEDNCTGCSICVSKCPYNVIQMVEVKQETEQLPFMKLFRATSSSSSEIKPEKGKKKKRKVVKCDRCADYGFSMCVFNCPTEAIRRGDPKEILKEAAI